MNKRLLKELKNLMLQQSRNLLDNDYIIYYEDSNINKIHALIKGPKESIYKHKFLRFLFEIQEDYPHSPPIVTFIKNDESRIHPILYENGRVCLTVLNTWPSNNEGWSSSMTIENILLTILSFLDYTPYIHEPGGKDDSTYTIYSEYQTWNTCLIKYIEYPDLLPEIFINYIYEYIYENIYDILKKLYTLEKKYNIDYYYTKCFYIEYYILNYTEILNNIRKIYYIIQEYYFTKIKGGTLILDSLLRDDNSFTCNICFDTSEYTLLTSLECKHCFHTICIKKHMYYNGNKCSMCRSDTFITTDIINPLTNRKIKINSKIINSIQHLF